ncbi:MAG TPA: hypothetical protein PK609_00340 [Candidatus Paceibacterota bacterium]|nr:hypothetical protein [Candidatus Paceibacterota bacterium]
MATVVNNPGSGDNGAGGWILAVGLLIVIALIAIFVWPGYGNGGGNTPATQVNVEVPTPDMGGSEGAQ